MMVQRRRVIVGSVLVALLGLGACEAAPTTSRPPLDEESSSEPPDATRPVAWPSPYIPPTRVDYGGSVLSILFSDGTAATLSFPSDTDLVGQGVQTTLSYFFDKDQPNQPHDILFVHGRLPSSIVAEEVRVFSKRERLATLHPVTAPPPALKGGLRGSPPFALVFREKGWLVVVTLPSRALAPTVWANLFPSVTKSGWPSVRVDDPLHLSEGFGEARGPHIEFNDKDPRWDVHTADTYVVMAPVRNCKKATDEISNIGGQIYGARCLAFEGGEPAIFVSMYGPTHFVRRLHKGLRLLQ